MVWVRWRTSRSRVRNTTAAVRIRALSRRVWLDTSEYTVDIADDGHAQVHFGDGAAGLVPDAGGTRLTVTYRGSAGASGNKGKGESIALQSDWKPGEPAP